MTIPSDQARLDSGFRHARVLSRRRESSVIASFELEPVDPAGWLPFEAGQFLPLRAPGGAAGPTIRTYSISSPPQRAGTYRITVKREGAPRIGLPDGVGSCFLHDKVQEGDLVEIGRPTGAFVLDRASARPVILASGGVGLTPLVSMLHALAPETGREVHFLHACENGDVHALADEVDQLARTRPGVTARFCYRTPTQADRATGRHDAEGLITRDLLRRWLPLDAYDVYLCGPSPFMKALYEAFRSLGVPRERIAYEFFGPATLLEGDVATIEGRTQPDAPAAPESDAAAQGGDSTVTFRRSGLSAAWTGADDNLLAFAERHGLSPLFSCRAGICNTCRADLIDGEVDYTADPLDPPGPGAALLCCARPRGPVVLDI